MPDIVLSGSSRLTSTLLEHGRVDEVVLAVFPVLLGTGRRLFAEGTPARSFELVSTKAMQTGIILSTSNDLYGANVCEALQMATNGDLD